MRKIAENARQSNPAQRTSVVGQKPGSYTDTSTVPIPKYKKMPDGSYAPVSTTRSAQQTNIPVKTQNASRSKPKLKLPESSNSDAYNAKRSQSLKAEKEMGMDDSVKRKRRTKRLKSNETKTEAAGRRAFGLGLTATGLFDVYNSINQYNASKDEKEKIDATFNATRGLGTTTMGLGMFFGGRTGSRANRLGMALNLASNIGKAGYDIYNGNGYAASQSVENLAQTAIMMSPLTNFSRGGKWFGGKGLGISTGISLGSNITNMLAEKYMQEGAAKNRVIGASNLAGGAAELWGDVSMTMATGGINKLVEGAADIYRKGFTEEGRRRAQNVGVETEVYDSLTKISGVQSLFKAIGGAGDLITGTNKTSKYMDIGGAIS